MCPPFHPRQRCAHYAWSWSNAHRQLTWCFTLCPPRLLGKINPIPVGPRTPWKQSSERNMSLEHKAYFRNYLSFSYLLMSVSDTTLYSQSDNQKQLVQKAVSFQKFIITVCYQGNTFMTNLKQWYTCLFLNHVTSILCALNKVLCESLKKINSSQKLCRK